MATSAEELNSGDFILHCPALPCPPFPSSAHPTPSSNTEIVNDSVERTTIILPETDTIVLLF